MRPEPQQVSIDFLMGAITSNGWPVDRGALFFDRRGSIPDCTDVFADGCLFPSGWSFLGCYLSPSGDYIYPMARWEK